MKRLFGGALLAIGILIMLTSGLCTLLVGVPMFAEDPSFIILAAIFGGLPFAVGFGFYKWGRLLLRDPEDHNVF